MVEKKLYQDIWLYRTNSTVAILLFFII